MNALVARPPSETATFEGDLTLHVQTCESAGSYRQFAEDREAEEAILRRRCPPHPPPRAVPRYRQPRLTGLGDPGSPVEDHRFRQQILFRSAIAVGHNFIPPS